MITAELPPPDILRLAFLNTTYVVETGPKKCKAASIFAPPKEVKRGASLLGRRVQNWSPVQRQFGPLAESKLDDLLQEFDGFELINFCVWCDDKVVDHLALKLCHAT